MGLYTKIFIMHYNAQNAVPELYEVRNGRSEIILFAAKNWRGLHTRGGYTPGGYNQALQHLIGRLFKEGLSNSPLFNFSKWGYLIGGYILGGGIYQALVYRKR